MRRFGRKGGLIQLSQDVVGYLRNPGLLFMDRSASRSPPVEPLDNGRGSFLSLASCIVVNENLETFATV